MWLMTTFGFFSVVQKQGESWLTVRARVRADLDELRTRYVPELSATQSLAHTDYAYRATVSHAELANAMPAIVRDITYDNFKSEVDTTQGHPRELVYAKVWSVLHDGLPRLDKPNAMTSPRRDAVTKYGGIVFDDRGRVLLREPRNHYDGYVWTFAKGDVDWGERPEVTALREVEEEMGVVGRIIDRVPGAFVGGTGSVGYFVMTVVTQRALPAGHPETQSLRWARPAEAAALIKATTNSTGRARDLAVLSAAVHWWETSRRRAG